MSGYRYHSSYINREPGSLLCACVRSAVRTLQTVNWLRLICRVATIALVVYGGTLDTEDKINAHNIQSPVGFETVVGGVVDR